MINHARTKRIEAIVDSGSHSCLFHGSIGKAHGMKVDSGVEGPLGGVIAGVAGKIYYHSVKLIIGADMIQIMAGFSDQLSVAAILGRQGFFDNFTVTFDPCNNPPGLIVERVHRA